MLLISSEYNPTIHLLLTPPQRGTWPLETSWKQCMTVYDEEKTAQCGLQWRSVAYLKVKVFVLQRTLLYKVEK
jgi:hypothetical protein